MIDRRGFLMTSTAAVLGCGISTGAQGERRGRMYGLIGKIRSVEGRREELAEILLGGISGMPGCLSYVVARDTEDKNALWVTEVWDSEESHQASLSLPSVQAAIEEGRPLISGFAERYVTTPVGGQGLAT